MLSLAVSYVAAYALAYFFTGLLVKKPIAKYPDGKTYWFKETWPDRVIMFALGTLLLLAAAFRWAPLLIAMAVFESFGFTAIWWNVIVWNVPMDLPKSPYHGTREHPDEGRVPAVYQCTMAATDLACAVALFSLL